MIKKIFFLLIFFGAWFLFSNPAQAVRGVEDIDCFCYYSTDAATVGDLSCSQISGGSTSTAERCQDLGDPTGEVTCLSHMLDEGDSSVAACVALCNGSKSSSTKFKSCIFTGASANDAENSATGDARNFVTPTLSVNIPTISLSRVAKEGGYLEVNWLGEYVTGMYKFLLSIAALFAVLMMMIGGMQYVSSPDGKATGEAKKRITNALTGLVLLFCVFLILYTVNPKLTAFESLSLEMIPPAPYAEEDDAVTGTLATDLGTVSGSNITGAGVNKVPTELISKVQAAAASLEGTGISLSIASSFRSVEDQKALIAKNCNNPPGSATCSPKTDRPPTCILKDLNPANCPHTTGHALDIWGVKNGRQCVRQADCLKTGGMAKCFADPCQAAVIKAMKDQGFCSLSTEAWHFESPKMSRKCN